VAASRGVRAGAKARGVCLEERSELAGVERLGDRQIGFPQKELTRLRRRLCRNRRVPPPGLRFAPSAAPSECPRTHHIDGTFAPPVRRKTTLYSGGRHDR
jgi:hypothetical protein